MDKSNFPAAAEKQNRENAMKQFSVCISLGKASAPHGANLAHNNNCNTSGITVVIMSKEQFREVRFP